jgi:hypothetical protein
MTNGVQTCRSDDWRDYNDNALTYIVHLVPTPDCTDPVKALRELLKRALRSWGLRCVTLSEVNQEQSGDGDQITRTQNLQRAFQSLGTGIKT